jgi:hypothetical protein
MPRLIDEDKQPLQRKCRGFFVPATVDNAQNALG